MVCYDLLLQTTANAEHLWVHMGCEDLRVDVFSVAAEQSSCVLADSGSAQMRCLMLLFGIWVNLMRKAAAVAGNPGEGDVGSGHVQHTSI